MLLTSATSQFPVSADITRNKNHILQQMEESAFRKAGVIHFCEGSLSGYAGVDFESFDGFDWSLLRESTLEIMERAKDLKLWVLLGSAHPLSEGHKPHNSVYIINDRGELLDRYDKRFCAGDASEQNDELAHFTPGNHFCIFTIKGVKCSVLICHEYRYPELHRSLKKRGVEVFFHSFHAGNMDPERCGAMEKQVGKELHPINPGKTLPEITMPATMISYAANNAVWISCSNTSAPESCWPAMAVRPDGVVQGKLRKNETGILVSEIDTSRAFYDSTLAWRERAIAGVFHSGTLVRDPRSAERKTL